MNRLPPFLFIALAFLLALAGGGCQTITHGTTQIVTVNTDPVGATVEIPGQESKTTPAFFVLSRTQSQVLYIKKDGYKPQQVTLVAQVVPSRATPEAGVFSVLGSVVDVASGGCWELAPDKVTVTLEAVAGGGKAATATAAATEPAKPAAPATPVVTGATPPIVATTTPAPAPAPTDTAAAKPANPAMSAVTEYNLLRLDNLLKQGAISKDEYDVLRNMVLTTGTLAGAGK
jgi:hypothetical protein